MDHDDAVPAEVQIGLDHVRALRDRLLEGGQGVLWPIPGSAAVGNDERSFARPSHSSAHARERSTARRHPR